jgi:putative glycosyltransferase (TIGR04348 family)
MLGGRYRVIVQTAWTREPADVLVALHARRSAASVERFHEETGRPIAVVLTGTDLYRDLAMGGETARSLDLASRIAVLQDDAPRLLPAAWRRKSDVIFQSAPALRHRRFGDGILRCAIVGHLREEKDPLTVMRAIDCLPPHVDIRVRHLGGALDLRLARAARAFARREPRYRYAGALPHGLTRAAIAASDLLIHPSLMEGGANVIVEAVTAGTPVVASRISGNMGMLGRRYPGYFEVGDAEGLAKLLARCAAQRRFLATLKAACDGRKALFRPAAETRAVRALVARLLA